MKKTVTLALLALTAALCLAGAANAAEITVSNALDIKLSLTFTYYDRESGELTTKGWWHVEPYGQTVVTLDADESRDIYYAAYNKDQFVDSTTRQNPQVMRWANYHNFTYTAEEGATASDAWEGKFYKVNGASLNIDGRPRR
jgi:hypothetical protein